MKKAILIITLAVVAHGSAMAQNRQGGCVAVALSSEQKAKGAFDATFAATGIIDLDLSVLFTPGTVKRFSDAHVLEVRVFTPRGHLYQSISVPFSADEKRKGRPERISGYPHPIPTEVPRSVSWERQPHFAVGVRLPVAGTSIVSSSLYGQWKAEAFIDGESLPCAAPAVFAITQ